MFSSNSSLFNKYLFPQQGRDSVCHCLFIFNFVLLKQIKSNIANAPWRSHEEWVGVTFAGIAAWQVAMEKLTNPLDPKNNAFSEYQYYMFDNGIHLEKIYTKKGKMYYKSSLDPLKNLQKIWLSPYHFVSTKNHPWVLEKSLPIYSDGNNHFIFDVNQQDYIKLNSTLNSTKAKNNYINNIPNNLVYLVQDNKYLELSQEQQEHLNLPDYSCLSAYKINKKNNKFKIGYKYRYLPYQAKNNIYFHVGLFQLINLAMGIDRENNLVTSNHELYPIYQDLRQAMVKHPSNPWGMPEFNPNNSLEYHLAKIFKEDAKLMQEVIEINKYPFNTYEHYINLDQLYNSKDKKTRKSLANNKNLLPGKAQMLAYSFSQSLLTIWAAAVSEKALYSVLELPKILRPLLYFMNKRYHKNILKTIYEVKYSNKLGEIRSFISIWQEIKQILHRQGIEELFSFDGHGVVISFDQNLISFQNNNMDILFPNLMADLGFTVIDSLYAEDILPWYAKIVN